LPLASENRRSPCWSKRREGLVAQADQRAELAAKLTARQVRGVLRLGWIDQQHRWHRATARLIVGLGRKRGAAHRQRIAAQRHGLAALREGGHLAFLVQHHAQVHQGGEPADQRVALVLEFGGALTLHLQPGDFAGEASCLAEQPVRLGDTLHQTLLAAVARIGHSR
jgi:hypothetical protein